MFNNRYWKEFKDLQDAQEGLAELLVEINKDFEEKKEQEADTEYARAVMQARKCLSENPAQFKGTLGESGYTGLQKMLSPQNLKWTLQELNKSVLALLPKIKDDPVGICLLTDCLKKGIDALRHPEDPMKAVVFSNATYTLYEARGHHPAWRRATGKLLTASAGAVGLAFGLTMGTAVAFGATMGTAILGSLTLGGAVAVIAAALIIVIIAQKILQKTETQEDVTKLNKNAKHIAGSVQGIERVGVPSAPPGP